MDIRKVKKLIELLEASSVDEIEIKEGEESVRISRNTGAPVAMAPPVAVAPAMPTPIAPAAPVAAAPEPAAPSSANAVKSPMVGTFYRSPSPEAAVFV
ncbi:MAG TPA: acetyl-CoA carboxylase biotin carboxyl carrier protein, partial [Halieaceae bacterium]|nr:acetyl-CoA carboxylase biotin carboxyl carrier protein [Halieaceae bacterium]